MKELIEYYQRKINSVKELLKNKEDYDDETLNRLNIKIGCYRAFLTDLKRAININDVSFRVCGDWWREIGETERLRLKDKHYPKSVSLHIDVFNCMSGRIKKIYIKEYDR